MYRPGENIIGRAAENEVVLEFDDVSKRHSSITVTGNVMMIKDLGSVNGTFIFDQATQKFKRVTVSHPRE
jgi:pSer/pThr/pTyr-binding forkhead associated (FHA) protein